MSDRIAVMSAGEVQQVGTPDEIYEHPANRFVADFIGDANILETEVIATDGDAATCRLSDGTVDALARGGAAVGAKGWVSIRPERIAVSTAEGAMPATIGGSVYVGADTQVEARLADGVTLRARLHNEETSARPTEGDAAFVTIQPGAARFLAE